MQKSKASLRLKWKQYIPNPVTNLEFMLMPFSVYLRVRPRQLQEDGVGLHALLTEKMQGINSKFMTGFGIRSMVARMVGVLDVDQVIGGRLFPFDVLACNLTVDNDEKIVVFRNEALAHIDPFDIFIFLFIASFRVDLVRFAHLALDRSNRGPYLNIIEVLPCHCS